MIWRRRRRCSIRRCRRPATIAFEGMDFCPYHRVRTARFFTMPAIRIQPLSSFVTLGYRALDHPLVAPEGGGFVVVAVDGSEMALYDNTGQKIDQAKVLG